MAQLLSTFYRTTLNKGKDLISVKDELQTQFHMQNSTTYALLSLLYMILMTRIFYIMPHLLLQPLVDAIVHGIHKESPIREYYTYAHHNKIR